MSANIPLHNLTVGQILDRSVRLYRQNFLTFWGIVALIYVPIGIINAVYSGTTFDQIFGMFTAMEDPIAMQEWVDETNSNAVRTNALAGLVTLVSSTLPIFGSCAIYYATAKSWMGERVSIVEAYRAVFARWQSIFGTMFLYFVAYFVILLWTIFACVIGWFTGFGMMMFFTLVVAPLGYVVVMLERESAWNALPRAWHLARRRFWWLVGFAVAIGLFNQVVLLGPQSLVIGGFGFLLVDDVAQGDLTEQSRFAFILLNALSIFLATIVIPVASSAMTLLYFALRTEQEALDLSLQLAEGGESDDSLDVGAAFGALMAAPRAAIDGVRPNRTELFRFAILSVVPLVLLAILIGLYIGLVFAIVSSIGL